jgi:beta-glucanase (GH16 family)
MANVYTPVDSSFKLVLDDEFNGNSLDTNIWSPGWFLQGGSGLSGPINTAENTVYNSSLVTVSGGDAHLNLIASPATLNGKTYPYQGALLQEKNGQFTYGYFEARVYLPAASPGVIANWPAWWLDGKNWPTDGEIDTMEGLQGKAQSTFHNSAGQQGLAASGDFTGWHVFGALWEPGEIDFYYDGKLQHKVTSGVTSSPEQMILDNTIGQWGGPTVTPSDMMVDYVHVYQNSPNAEAVTPQSGYGGPGDTGGGGTVLPPPPPPPPPPPVGTLALAISEDYYKGDAQFTVSMDGQQVGGTQTAHVLHSTGADEVFLLTGTWDSGQHDVKISFINDYYAGNHSTDRNLYVDSIALNGSTYSKTSAALMGNGSHDFVVGGTIPTQPAAPDTLTLHLSEDAWNGDAQFQVSIDGKTLDTKEVVTALRSANTSQDFIYTGNFGPGSHNVGVTFLNDAYGGTASTDRNLFVGSVTYDSHTYTGATLFSAGTAHFSVSA